MGEAVASPAALPRARRPKRPLSESAVALITVLYACIKLYEKRRGFPLPLLSALTEAVAASTVFAVAGIPDANGRKRAVHPVAVVSAIGHTAGNAAVDVLHLPPPYADSIVKFCKKYPKPH